MAVAATLATLPANEFPSVDNGENNLEFDIETATLKNLIESTSFAMAQQDVRYYLNGMLWEVVATAAPWLQTAMGSL